MRPSYNLDDRRLREMIEALRSIEELLKSIISLQEIPEGALMLQDILNEAQTAIDMVAPLRWIKLDTESAERQLVQVREFSGFLERTMVSPLQ